MDTNIKQNHYLKYIFEFILVIIPCIFFFLKPFQGLDIAAMNFIGVFLLMIVMMMIHFVADYVVIILGLILMVTLNVGSFTEIFSLFGDTSFWNLLGIFGFSAGIINSGLLNRLTKKMFAIFPSDIRGQVTAIFVTGLILSPLIPSVTAKMTLLASFALVIAKDNGYKKSSKEAIALYMAMYLSGYIIGLAFSTGGTSAQIILSMVPKDHLTFLTYLLNTGLWLVLILGISYIMLIRMFPKGVNNVKIKSKEEKVKMSKNEKLALTILVLSLFFWIVGPFINVPSYLVGIIALCAFLIQGTLSETEFKSKISWDMVILITGFMSTAKILTSLHIDTWLAELLEPVMAPVVKNIFIFIPILCLLVVIVRTFVVSEIACMSIFYAIFAKSCSEVGINSFIILFITLIISQTWHMSYNQMGVDAAEAATNNELIEYSDIKKYSYIYIGVCIIIFELSIPLWYLTGMLT